MDLFTLNRLVRDLGASIDGARVRDVQAHGAGIVSLELAGREPLFLCARREWRGIVTGFLPAAAETEDNATRRFADRLRDVLSGARLEAPSLLGDDRIVIIPAGERGRIVLEIPSASILWLEAPGDEIAARLVNGQGPSRLASGSSYTPPGASLSPGGLIAREAAYRAGAEDPGILDVGPAAGDPAAVPIGAEAAARAFEAIRSETASSEKAAIYRLGSGAYAPFAWRATHLGEPVEECATLLEAALRSLRLTLEGGALERSRHDAAHDERRRRRRIERALDAAKSDLEKAQSHAALRRSAEALLAYAADVPSRAAEVTLADPADPSRTIVIALDPSLSAPANAKRYFDLARRMERAIPRLERRVGTMTRALGEADAKIAAIEAAADPQSLEKARGKGAAGARGAAGRGGAGPGAGAGRGAGAAGRAEAREKPESGFRRYRTSEGWMVLVGKNDEENDRLTHRVARPDDIWLHAHGAAGSHVILRREGRNQNPSRQTLAEAASIAAYYSKARTSKRAPVIYTLRKYVRKPRGGEAGLAICSHEKMLMVKPELPAEQSEETEA